MAPHPFASRGVRSLVAVLVFTACATNPATGKRELSLVSESQEIQMGQEGAQAAAQQIGVYPDSALQRYVASLGRTLAASSERPNLPWSFTVADDPVVNAFALPGGPIFITRGILGYMNSEAQLVSVLGHEIGHVTAKHSVRQISRQQLLSIGLIGAMVVRPELQRFGDVASQGLGLLFLKYGRDDETQADDLGFRYMTSGTYDPREMAEMFRILERTSSGSERAPEWLSTHPDPGNRVQKTLERIAAAGRSFAGAKVNRDVFLRRIDGVVYGEDPRNGFFQQQTFLHPALRFRFDFPAGWKTLNQATQVVGVSPQQDAQVALTTAGNAAPQQALSQFLGQQGISAGQTSTSAINGLPAAVGQFAAQTEQGVIAGYVAFFQLDGATYRIIAITPQQALPKYDAAFRQVVGSFSRLTDPKALAAKPSRIRIVQIPRAMTIGQFHQQYPSTIQLAELALINGVESGATLEAGRLVKRVVVE
jgi:predicted Zn-dependent protease